MARFYPRTAPRERGERKLSSLPRSRVEFSVVKTALCSFCIRHILTTRLPGIHKHLILFHQPLPKPPRRLLIVLLISSKLVLQPLTISVITRSFSPMAIAHHNL